MRFRRPAAAAAAAAAVACLALLACTTEVPAPPEPDTAAMEPVVRARIAEARHAVATQPRSAASWGELGMVLHAHELFADAAVCYRTAAELDARDERWPYYLGVVLSVEGEDVEGALTAYRRALELRPNYAPAHLRLGDLLAGADRLDEAERAYRRALELAPELAPAELGLGRTLLRRGDAEAAVGHLERARRALPKSGAALDALGRAYLQVGRTEEAREVAEAARGARGFDTFSDPLMSAVVGRQASTTLLWPRARQALADGDTDKALGLLRRIAELQPADPEVHLQLGLLLRQTERPREAVDAFAAAAGAAQQTGEPLPAWAHHEWGLALAGQQRYGEAVERFRTALRLQPDNAQGHFHLGLALEAVGRPDEAMAAYRRAMELEPNELTASRIQALGAGR